MDRLITAVCGLGRCGSSLVMQMLAAGGMLCTGEAPDYEITEVIGLPNSWEFLSDIEGKAVKVLDPHVNTPKEGFEYRFIWIDRNPIEQAKSIAKFLLFTQFIWVDSKQRKKLQRTLPKDRTACLKTLSNLAEKPPLILSFEEILQDPTKASLRLSAFCGGLDVNAMAKVVRPRSTECLPFMLEMELLREAAS